MEGWIKIHRQMIKWEWYQDTNVKVVFLHLLLLANHEEKRWQGHVIKRGQLITSLAKLSKGTKLSVHKIRVAIDKLKMTGEITSKSSNRFTMISIENWDLYQLTEEKVSNKNTNKCQTDGKQVATNKNDKNIKNEKNIINSGQFSKPTLEDINDYCKEKGYTTIDTSYFYNYYEANGWKVGKNNMKSWKATLNMWNSRIKKNAENKNKQINNYNQREYTETDFNKLYANLQMGE